MSSSNAAYAKIDVHHHYLPPMFVKEIEKQGGDPSGWHVPNWTPETSLDIMRTLGCQTSILSVTAPGAEIAGPKGSVGLAREMNDWIAHIRDSQSQSFGFFAAMPALSETKAVIAEIGYALDTLKADGVCLFTRSGEGADSGYLGATRFRPIWEELNKRKAVVFIHPTHTDEVKLVHPWLSQPMIDYPHESTRTALDLVLTGTKRTFPECKIILSHAGGTLPFLIERVASMLPEAYRESKLTKEDIVQDAKSFYFDLALSTTPNVLDCLMEFAPSEQILFGSDFPYAPRASVIDFARVFDERKMDEGLRRKICFDNAQKLFPRWLKKE